MTLKTFTKNWLQPRLLGEFANPRDALEIREVLHIVSLKSQNLPLPERLAPRPTRPGTLDLTAANLLVTDVALHAKVVTCAPWELCLVSIRKGTDPGSRRVGFIYLLQQSSPVVPLADKLKSASASSTLELPLRHCSVCCMGSIRFGGKRNF